MLSPYDLAAEALQCRESGNDYGYGQCLQELAIRGYSVAEIRELLAEAGSDGQPTEVEAPHNITEVTALPRDPRMPIPRSEWPRPRFGFAN